MWEEKKSESYSDCKSQNLKEKVNTTFLCSFKIDHLKKKGKKEGQRLN